jgi:hypothetical protein
MDKNKSGQMSLSGIDQPYNNVKRGKVDRVRLIIFRVCTATKVIPKRVIS